MRLKRVIVGAVVALAACAAAQAVPIQVWSYEDLWKEADLVVVGTVKSTGDASPNGQYTRSDDHVEVHTTFRVVAKLKGDAERATATVSHYRYHRPEVAEVEVVDGPAFIRFDAKSKDEYLLFLKLGAGGHWEPVSGQFSPGQSVRILQAHGPGDAGRHHDDTKN